MRLRARDVTIALHALSLVDKAEPVQICFTHFTWGTNGVCECKLGGKSTWHWMDHVSWVLGLFPKTTSRRQAWYKTVGRPWPSKCPQSLVYSILSCVRTHMNKRSLKWHSNEGPVTNGFRLHLRVRDRTTWFWRCVGTAFGHFLLGSHNFMVTALGSCVKWPLEESS